MTKKVAVIGAGAAGLCAARKSLDEGLEVQIFEQTDKVGGTWVYEEKIGTHSSMYEVMKTNLPKELMSFRDVPFSKHLPSFMSHRNVLTYLEDYSTDLPIKFNSKVEQVYRDNGHWVVVVDGTSTRFDIVFVCNGHYARPKIPFETSKFKGHLIHSHDYRKASTYRNQDVTVIGVGPSGIDIALQLAKVCGKVTLIGSKATYENLPSNIEQLPVRIDRIEESSIVTDDGRSIPAQNIIVCTGYLYSFPFFKNEEISLKEGDMMVSSVYEHVVHTKYPDSLYFIGLNLVAITFPLFEYQVKLSLSFALGKIKIPDDIQNWEEVHRRHQSERNLPPKFFHLLMNDQWEYLRRLARIGEFEHWPFMNVMEKMFNYLFEVRKQDVVNYKNIDFILNEEETDFVVVKV